MAETEILPQKIVDTRSVILKSSLDSNRVKLQGEKLKTSFFARFGFLKPKPKNVRLIAFSKYYEPYIVIGGKYSIDYCKRHGYALKVEDRTQALFIDGKKLKPETLTGGCDARVIKLVGEEHSHYENESYVILDRLLQKVSAENLFFAPSENDLENGEGDFDLRKPKISLDEEIAFLRSKIAKRPADVGEIVREKFEINERTIIYSPVYELTYKNMKNGEKVTVLINGVSGGVTVGKFDRVSGKLGDSLGFSPANLVATQTGFFRAEPEQMPVREVYVSNATSNNLAENLVVQERMDNTVVNMPQQKRNFQFNAENMTRVATDFMARLGYTQNRFPTKLYLEGENNVVELQLHEGTARVQIDPKTGEVKTYEILEANEEEGFFTSKRKWLFVLSSIAVVAAALKLFNVF
jgi:hypothetical protein